MRTQASGVPSVALCHSASQSIASSGPLAPTWTSLSVLLGTTSCHSTCPVKLALTRNNSPSYWGRECRRALHAALTRPLQGKNSDFPRLHTRTSKHKRMSSGLPGARAGQREAGAPAQRCQVRPRSDTAQGPWAGSLARPEPWPHTAHTGLLFSPFYAQHFPLDAAPH